MPEKNNFYFPGPPLKPKDHFVFLLLKMKYFTTISTQNPFYVCLKEYFEMMNCHLALRVYGCQIASSFKLAQSLVDLNSSPPAEAQPQTCHLHM